MLCVFLGLLGQQNGQNYKVQSRVVCIIPNWKSIISNCQPHKIEPIALYSIECPTFPHILLTFIRLQLAQKRQGFTFPMQCIANRQWIDRVVRDTLNRALPKRVFWVNENEFIKSNSLIANQLVSFFGTNCHELLLVMFSEFRSTFFGRTFSRISPKTPSSQFRLEVRTSD